jgi:hypothetical protein
VHGERHPLDRHVGRGLPQDGLGAADGVGCRRRPDDPVGPAQGVQGAHGEQVGIARPHTHPHEAARLGAVVGEHRLHRGRAAGPHLQLDRGAQDLGLGAPGGGGPGREGPLQVVGEVDGRLAHDT